MKASSLAGPLRPQRRIAAVVQDGDDFDSVRKATVDDRMPESVKNGPAATTAKTLAAFGKVLDVLNGRVELTNEELAMAGTNVIEAPCGCSNV